MASYTIISKEIKDYRIGKNRNTDIFLCSFLKAIRTYETGKCHARQQKIVELTKIKLRTVQNCISRLRSTPFLNVEIIRNKQKKMNIYSFDENPENWFKVNNELFYTEIGIKEIGLLLLIKSLCLNDTNTTLYSCAQISIKLGQSRITVSKLIDSLLEKGMLLKLKQGYQLPANYFFLNFSNDYEEFVYDSIVEFCKKKNSKLFIPNIEPLKQIAAKYPFREGDFLGLDLEGLRKYHLPHILNARCTTLPDKIESLNYFIEILNINFKTPDEGSTLTL